MRSSICRLFIGSNLKDLWGDNNFDSRGNSCSDLHKQILPSLWYVSSIHLSSSSSDGPYICHLSIVTILMITPVRRNNIQIAVVFCSKWSRCSNCYEYFDITGLTVASKAPLCRPQIWTILLKLNVILSQTATIKSSTWYRDLLIFIFRTSLCDNFLLTLKLHSY